MTNQHAARNPLLVDWSTPFDVPPFGAIGPEHFAPAPDALLKKRGLADGLPVG